MSNFICRYCGKEVPFNNRNYEVGLALAERASFEALGHIDGVTPYLICNSCAEEITKEENP